MPHTISKRLLDVVAGLCGLVFLGVTAPVMIPMCLAMSGCIWRTHSYVGHDRRRRGSRRAGETGCRRRVLRPGQPVRLAQWAIPDFRHHRWLTLIIQAPYSWNLLKGEISLCGPRLLGEKDYLRLKLLFPDSVQAPGVRPGLLGLAQLDDDPDPAAGTQLRHLDLDASYVRRLERSPGLDLRIILFSVTDLLGWSRSA